MRTSKTPVKFKNTETKGLTGAEKMTVEEKLEFLKEIGREELIDVFKGYKPRQVRKRRSGAPLDQRVAISITESEKVLLDREIDTIKKSGEKMSISQFIRNRAVGTVDIQQWAQIVDPVLNEIDEVLKDEGSLRYRKRVIHKELDDLGYDDSEEAGMLELELTRINEKLNLVTAKTVKRKYKLTGRMSMVEAETVRWRAQKLYLSTSDYLRMLIFGLSPNTDADRHLSVEAKQRFYLSVLEVSKNGFGTSPAIYECSQCAHYQEENEKLKDRIKQLESFL